ncbi:MAG: hypothetical protein KGR46_03605 [Verrucomicrobia bacterium]|nr:hypothetical protein [Verrucomicrobiota bacterium]
MLPTDSVQTIGEVLDCLRRQPGADRIEVILVAGSGNTLPEAWDFSATRVVVVDSLSPIGAARAAGVRAATAPFVFLGETHSYPQEGWLDAALDSATAEGWDVMACGMENANATTLLSWAGFLLDYSRWSSCQPGGSIPEAPLYNAVFRRDLLLELGVQLEGALSAGNLLPLFLANQKSRIFHEPKARLTHRNVDRPLSVIRERYLLGVLIGKGRAAYWPLWRCWLYAGASPLIPFVLMKRLLSGYLSARQAWKFPRATLLVMVALQMIRAWGEMAGYLGFGTNLHEAEMTNMEIRKRDYCRKNSG